jgi:DNA modification methylase
VEPYYDDGQIQIWNADCRDVLPTIDPASVALVLTDPPYGVAAVQRNGRPRNGKDTPPNNAPGTWRSWEVIDGDDEPFDPAPLLRFPRLILFGANHYADRLPPTSSWFVWDKRNGATPDDNADGELIWSNIGGVLRIYRQCWRGFTREKDQLEPPRHVHPTQKPVALMLWLLERASKPGDLILDPYMGSGPIAQAAKMLGRRYIGIELSEAYCQIAVQRLSQQVLPLDVA